jgi:hypothetical protein
MKLKNESYPVKIYNFVTKISRYFAKFRNISRYEISRNKKQYLLLFALKKLLKHSAKRISLHP